MIRSLVVDPRIKVKSADLLEMPVVVYISKFNEETAEKFSETIGKATEINQPVIPIVIDSYGGHVYSLLGLISEIQNSRIPIATICQSKAMSAGAILFGFGHEGLRFMAPNATLMIHEVSSFQFGKVEDLKADAEETDRLNTLIFKLLAKNCNRSEEYFLEIIHERGHADWYLTAKEAKKHNLCNHIILPEFKVEVNVNMTFGFPK
jgi:ATP-dependent Clp endopeptidase proteolytic subunit ClpP